MTWTTRGITAAAVSAGLLTAGCGGTSPDAAPVGSAPPAASSAAPGSPPASGSAPSSPVPSGSTPSSSAPSSPAPADPTPSSDDVRLEVSVADGKVTPSGEKIDVRQGQTVVITVTSDVDEEIHAHTAGDGYYFEVRAGQVSRGEFVAEDKGRFEVELHESGDVIAFLNVR